MAPSLVRVRCAHTGQLFDLPAADAVVLETPARLSTVTLGDWAANAADATTPRTGWLCPLGNQVQLLEGA